MEFKDKVLECADCEEEFIFTAEEQEFFQSKGYANEPKRCPACRQARRNKRYESQNSYGIPRQTFPAICAECGKECEVPFEPDDRPVYCRDCYRVKQSRISIGINKLSR